MKVCIACQADVSGKKAVRVKEDRIIKAIRKVKKAFKIAQMNELYVCEKDIPQHLERRRSFEKSLLFASVLGGLILVLVIAVLLLSGKFEIWPIISAFIVAGFIIALPVFKYAPALEGKVPEIVGAAAPETNVKKTAPATKAKKPAKGKRR